MKYVVISLALMLCIQSCNPVEPFQAPLFDNLGSYQLEVTASSNDAKQFFNQGLILANGFNHEEAVRSFSEALRLDSTCVMAYWGMAYVLGPNINSSSSLGEWEHIRGITREASKRKEGLMHWEKLLVQSVEARYPKGGKEPDGQAYAKALKRAYDQYPDHDLIATLYAESLMNEHAWDLYVTKGGDPKPWTPEIVSVLEGALQKNPENPLANHLYIHAMEASSEINKAMISAERLKTLVPGAGHLVHMPSHIYINTGDYDKGSAANEQAVIVDSSYIAQCQVKGVYPQLYFPHNYHFLAATAALEGRAKRSIEASFKTAEIIDRHYLGKPGFETAYHFLTIPYNVLVKFDQWEKIMMLPRPEEKYPIAIWHYARGMAYANTGRLAAANTELSGLIDLMSDPELEDIWVFGINSAKHVTQIAKHVLEAEIQIVVDEFGLAEAFLLKALELEDRLSYNEPPDWFFSVRHHLGDLYLKTNQFAQAEQIYNEDLEIFPKNGYALNGLYYSLQGQGSIDRAKEVKKRFEFAWRNADIQLQYSRIDRDNRKNLAINIDKNSATNLIYIATGACGLN